MSGWDIGFDRPLYLVLLLILIPVLWISSFRSLAGLGKFRRVIALLLRTTVIVLIVLALAEIQLLKTSDKITVIYLLDQSESIPLDKRQAMAAYVSKEVADHRRKDRRDRAGVIVFGRNANIEIPPFDDDIVAMGGLESYYNLRTDATNLEVALKLAKASFPEDSAKRIVLVTDGNENLGDARSIGPSLAEDGIGVDVVPIQLETRAEVSVEKVVLPSDIRLGQPIDIHVVVNNHSVEPVTGKLKVVRRIGPQEQLVSEETVELQPGKTPYRLPEKIEQSAVYTYQADFFPADPKNDLMVQNNRASAFTHVRGKGNVLLIENWQQAGQHERLIESLRKNNIEVTVMGNDQLYSSLAELQSYDCVILADVPRSAGDDADSVKSFSDAQVSMLVRNTEQMGCGLVMIGGSNSFGVGGWSNTEIEKAMPVDFQIKNSKIRAVGALALMMHASEIAEGNFWQKEVAKQAINALGPMDYCGLLHWDGDDTWLWGSPQGIIQVGERRNMMLARLGRMTPGDMPEFGPSMKKALTSFNRVNASVKMMIIISDGDPSEPTTSLLKSYAAAGIQVTTVAVGAHGPAGHQTLKKVADMTKGNYYVVRDPKALPRIYQAETRRVAKPLIHENDAGINVEVVGSSEIMEGIAGTPPRITGLVMTTLKDNPLVEVALRSQEPADEKNATLMAAWTYGLGRTAVVTTDDGAKWATSWTLWENYDKFYSQLIRWAMRPVNDTGKFSVATQAKDGKVQVVVTALDKDDEFLNFLNMSAAAIDPELKDFEIKVQQVAPGRYIAEFDASKEGNYFVNVHPGPGYAPILTGVNVPYSAEFRERESNMALIKSLAQLRPRGGDPGKVIDPPAGKGANETPTIDTFRRGLPPSISSQDVWPLFLVIMGCVFFADVFVRRVTVTFDWVPVMFQRIRARLRKQETQEPEERLARLRTTKAAATEQIDERRAATRFEPVLDEVASKAAADEILQQAAGGTNPNAPPAPPRQSQLTPDAPEAESYTARLLKAKQRARKDE